MLHFAEGYVIDDVVLERPAQDVIALAADRQDLHRLAFPDQLQSMIAGKADDGRVEATCKTTLTSCNDEKVNLIAAGPGQKQWRFSIAGIGGGQAGQHLVHAFRVGTCSLGRLLRTAQLRRGDHLHRLGDLLRRLDGGDPVFQILK